MFWEEVHPEEDDPSSATASGGGAGEGGGGGGGGGAPEPCEAWTAAEPGDSSSGGAVLAPLRLELAMPPGLGRGRAAAGLVGLELQEPRELPSEVAGAKAEEGRGLLVLGVDPDSPLAVAADGGPGVCPGDAITEVQGQAGTTGQLQSRLDALVKGNAVPPAPPWRLRLAVQPRPASFTAPLVRRGASWRRLGVSVALLPQGRAMLVARVWQAGLAAEWNELHSEARICAGDRLVAVNGFQGSAIELYAQVQATGFSGALHLQVETPPRHMVPKLQAWAKKAQDLEML